MSFEFWFSKRFEIKKKEIKFCIENYLFLYFLITSTTPNPNKTGIAIKPSLVFVLVTVDANDPLFEDVEEVLFITTMIVFVHWFG